MSIVDAVKKRRSVYDLNKKLPVPEDQVMNLIRDLTELVPDAFNYEKSAGGRGAWR
ncbi:hypothetical protein [Pseudoramibacter faecis]|uniref:hypothetical protein n=1 Tax=Pseudoramibacter faecis TaxID=3108534 RepID=UPI003CCA2DC4